MDHEGGLSLLFLNVGLRNGVLLRTSLDNVTGELTGKHSHNTRNNGSFGVSLCKLKLKTRPPYYVAVLIGFIDTRSRFLGVRPVKLFRIKLRGHNALLALSSRPWVCYNQAGRYHMIPLSYQTLEYAANFTSEACPEGVVAVAQNTLK